MVTGPGLKLPYSPVNVARDPMHALQLQSLLLPVPSTLNKISRLFHSVATDTTTLSGQSISCLSLDHWMHVMAAASPLLALAFPVNATLYKIVRKITGMNAFHRVSATRRH